MADIGNSTVYIGNPDWYRGDPESTLPSTLLDPDTVQSVVGGFFRLDASASKTSDHLDVLYFKWSAVEVPVGSTLSLGPLFPQEYVHWTKQQLRVEVDTVGVYKIELTVWGANGGRGSTDSTIVLSLPSESPLFENISLDTSWVWNTLPSYWNNQPSEDKVKLELLWRGTLQLLGKELMRAYNVDANKSITSIQDSVYDRWVPIPLDIDLSSSSLQVHRLREAPLAPTQGRFAALTLDPNVWRDLLSDREYSFEGSIISPTEILPLTSANSDFTPSNEDEGRRVEVEVEGVTLEAFISYVDEEWRGKLGHYRYVLDRPLLDQSASVIGLDLGATYRIKVSRSRGDTLPIPVMVGGAANLLTNYSVETGIGTFSSPIPEGSTVMRALPSMLVEDALRLGVSPGDYLYVELSIPDTSESVAVHLKVEGLTPSLEVDANTYHVLFDTRVSTFSELAETFLSIFNQPISVVSEWRSSLASPAFLDSVESRKISPDRNNSLSISGEDKAYIYTVKPLKLTRLSRVKLDSDIKAIIKLSEFVEDHNYEVGQVITEGGRSVSLERAPLHLLENRDFIISPEVSEEGEELVYLDFLTTTHTSNTPRRLWAETLVRDNRAALEANFGGLLSFPYAEWKERNLSMSYRAILAAMLTARMSGPTLRNIQSVLSVLCGIPFAERRCRVISIDRDLDPTLVTSTGLDTRVTVEEIDQEGRLLGKIRAYKIPAVTDESHTETSGTYYGGGPDGRLIVGDILEAYTPIGLGALVEDRVSDNRGQFKEVRDRHRFKARANIDSTSLKTEGDITLLFDFIRDIKPSYIDFLLSLFKYNTDRIEIESRAILKYRSRFFDNPYLLRGPAEIYDDEIPGRALNDLPSYTVLSTWFPRDGEVHVNSDGTLTLSSESSYFTMDSLSDGFIRYPGNSMSPLIRHRYTKDWINLDSEGEPSLAWIRGETDILESDRTSEVTLPDYIVFRSGIAEGMYRILRVESKTQLTFVPIGPDGANLSVFEGEGISFVIGRISTEVLFDGVVSEGGDSGVHLVGEGVIHDGIAAGDELSFPNTTRGRYSIREVRYTRTDRGEPAVFVSPYGHQLLSSELNPDSDSPIRAIIRRPQLSESVRGEYTITRAEEKYGPYAYRLVLEGVVSPASIGLSIGDKIISTDDQGVDTYIVGIFSSILWLAYAPNITTSIVAATRSTGISSGSLDDVDTTLGSSCLIVTRPTILPRQSWASRHLSTITAQIDIHDDLLTRLVLTESLHQEEGHRILNSIQAGDMLKVITPIAGAPTRSDLSSHPFVDGFGLLRIVEVLGHAVRISQPLPLPSTYVGGSFSVKLVRQTNLSSAYWRIT